MVVPPPAKNELRRLLRARRQVFDFELDNNSKLRAISALADRVLCHIEGTGCVAAYFPIGAEIDTMSFISGLRLSGKTVLLPHVTGRDDTPRFLAWHADDPLEAGPFGLLQPAADARQCAPDVILTPLLGFDRALNRIGYGAGHYDRAFAALPDAYRIGLAWSVQECAEIPTEAWDIPLQAVATELEWITR